MSSPDSPGVPRDRVHDSEIDQSKNWRAASRWGLALPPALLLVMLIYGAIKGYSGDNFIVFALGVATLALGFLPVAINNSFNWPRGHVLISLLALVYAGYFGIPAIVRYAPVSGGVVPGSMGDRLVMPSEVIDAQVVALVGFISLIAAYANPLLARIRSRSKSPEWDWTPRTTMLIALGMLGMGWAISLLQSSSSSTDIFGTGFISTLASAQIFGLIPLVLLWHRYRFTSALTMLAIIVPISMLFGFLTGSKREALNAIAIVFLTLMVLRGRFGWRWILLGILGLSLLYPLNRYYQDYLIGDSRTSAVEVLVNPQRIVSALARFVSESSVSDLLDEGLESTALRIDGLGVTAVIIGDTPNLVPFQNGRTLALFFIAPIPRAFWPGKPNFTVGQWVTDNYSHGLDTRTAPTQIGEFYFNFGVTAVILGMALLGTVLRVINDAFVGPDITSPALLIVVVVIYYLCTKFESGVAKQYANILFAAGPILVVHVAARMLGGCFRSDARSHETDGSIDHTAGGSAGRDDRYSRSV